MNKVFLVLLATLTTGAYAQTKTCTFDKKDPVGTKEEQQFKAFDYQLSADKKTMTLSNLDLTADAKEYAAPGSSWPTADTGTHNPAFAKNPRIAERHKGYEQYKHFNLVDENVLWARFEVLVDKHGHARIPIT